ncbi:hypothetical protein J7E29_16725 [Streptomyces sp. ISL-90]|nr:hypothetical protein [Streptomyces sp. ISL-90]
MMTLRAFSQRARNRRALIAVVAASAIALGVASVGFAAGVEAQTRARLSADVDRVTESIASTVEVGRAVVASHLTAAVCVADVSSRLAPVAGSGTRFRPAALGHATTIVERASDAAPVPAYDPAPPPHPAAEAGVDELDATLVVLRGALATTEEEVAALASKARSTEQDCASARNAETALMNEIALRTDELIAANPKAAADTISGLTVARDAVVAVEADSIAKWLAAADTVESSQAAAVLVEQQAAEAARGTTEDTDGTSEPGLEGPPWWVWNGSVWELSIEELCRYSPDLCPTDSSPRPPDIG